MVIDLGKGFTAQREQLNFEKEVGCYYHEQQFTDRCTMFGQRMQCKYCQWWQYWAQGNNKIKLMPQSPQNRLNRRLYLYIILSTIRWKLQINEKYMYLPQLTVPSQTKSRPKKCNQFSFFLLVNHSIVLELLWSSFLLVSCFELDLQLFLYSVYMYVKIRV